MLKVLTKNADETKSFAKDLAKDFKEGGIIALTGKLGAGKTTFVQGFALGLGIKHKITSPTFLIIRQYDVPNQKNFFYHIDLYRLEKIDLKSSGLQEILDDSSNIILIEWADKISKQLIEFTKKIEMKKISEDLHQIQLTN